MMNRGLLMPEAWFLPKDIYVVTSLGIKNPTFGKPVLLSGMVLLKPSKSSFAALSVRTAVNYEMELVRR